MATMLAVWLLVLLLPIVGRAQPAPGPIEGLRQELERLRQQAEESRRSYEDQLRRLQRRIEELEQAERRRTDEAARAAAPPPPAPVPPPALPGIRVGGAPLLFDISFTGDFVGNVGNDSRSEQRNRFFPRELDLALQGAVDPYMRADVFLELKEESKGEEKIELDEGYATILSLPFGLQARLGKFRPKFGRLNTFHNHDLPQTDRPNVLKNLFGEDGLSEKGGALSAILPLPFFSEVEVATLTGDNPESFGRGSIRTPLLIGHLKSFFEIGENSAFQIGLSGGHGPNVQNRRTTLQGLDLTYKWKPLDRPGESLILQAELLRSRREVEGDRLERYGGYFLTQYQLSRRWYAGFRYDWSQLPTERGSREQAFSPLVTFALSPFSQFRLQYKLTERTFDRDVSELFFQFTFRLGRERPELF
ncbi:MAG: hypothetical protein HYY85_18970 [Deltaproteobacteria bacterium]|nr:hypothetical protein [Deltaproteobacteria bacterium]